MFDFQDMNDQDIVMDGQEGTHLPHDPEGYTGCFGLDAFSFFT